ncbi:amino acid deaminase [Halomonas alkalicola]|uniref:amino acid deaminase n=1 Tax=Halomonas alkalicola TaxID=1930622 RepID=UPI0026602D3C|nr:amino acid deaminase [Halomonas alkalicola]
MSAEPGAERPTEVTHEPSAEVEEKGCPETGRGLLSGVSLPAAVVHEAPLAHNLIWMQRFAEARGAHLAPHGKTTMAPALFRRQLEAGAWGMTLATAPQCRAAFAHGIRRLLLANQLVGEANMAIVAGLIEAGAELFVVVDGEANVAALDRFFSARGLRLPVLIELGIPGGRCGCRSAEAVLALARRVNQAPALRLAGLEGYEGVVAADDPETAVRAYARELVTAAHTLAGKGLFEREVPLVTAAGSAWYDLIAEAFRTLAPSQAFAPVLRPGCYVVHDHGLYAEAQRHLLAREGEAEGLRPALEVFAQVQSLPEPGLAIVAMGRRDVGGDRMPLALRRYREGGEPAAVLPVAGWEVVKLMDQHAFVRLPEPPGDMGVGDVRVGDIVAFGVSHPCLTFDKWRAVLRVDDRLEVQEVMATCF